MDAAERSRSTMSEFVTLDEIRAAKERIAGVAVRTPLYRVERARLRLGKLPEPEFDLYIKAESEQPIGSFKLRGAYNMVAQLSSEALGRGVILTRAATTRRVWLMRQGRWGRRRDRDARERSGGEDSCDAGVGGGDCVRWAGFVGEALKSRGAGRGVWICDDSALRCAADHRRTSYLWAGDCRAVAGGGAGDLAGERGGLLSGIATAVKLAAQAGLAGGWRAGLGGGAGAGGGREGELLFEDAGGVAGGEDNPHDWGWAADPEPGCVEL